MSKGEDDRDLRTLDISESLSKVVSISVTLSDYEGDDEMSTESDTRHKKTPPHGGEIVEFLDKDDYCFRLARVRLMLDEVPPHQLGRVERFVRMLLQATESSADLSLLKPHS